ncbi:sn-glycerol-3-phosphate ABC transporter ATP-binding protein UgpC [Microbaculum marinisediminis]|uniref:Sn-glycerol-3-phosphate ABC transporter ATP-binding protein UgpC n=1 Tax=Microbaculum marinisediminis TaxID=2931392 RepID=A0AAW5QYX6_9HYPH|nr:sn-glycerol-3-phosphate ABC transporter ATP-binding protein UgpC [Microbaculum sp. A6E488]MCT8973271.1 sn-glycerol-3-phosphate ABC transporter ATP-binding protein UgpC [Microbaculum sp. A6E488]
MADVILSGVRKVYPGAVEAVKAVDLRIADGTLCVLVGPSGCGKSTLLRMIAGLETVSEGAVAIGGEPVNDREPAARDIAMVFQNYALYPHMSVYDNMAYGLRNRRTPKPEIERRVRAAAGLLAIEPMLARKPRQLSGGQRQRVAMGRAIVREPKVFLFDEPLSNLDAKLRVQMRIELKRLQRSLGTTSIYVTHDQLEAMTLADLLVVMNEGRIEQIGTAMAVYEKPATTFVAGFIGSPPMNLIPAEPDGEGLDLDGTGHRIPPPKGAGGPVVVGIRPEDLVIGEGGEEGDSDTVPVAFAVTGVEPIGAESLVHGRTGAGHEITVRAPGYADFAPGHRLTAHTGLKSLHFFDRDSGARIA